MFLVSSGEVSFQPPATRRPTLCSAWINERPLPNNKQLRGQYRHCVDGFVHMKDEHTEHFPHLRDVVLGLLCTW